MEGFSWLAEAVRRALDAQDEPSPAAGARPTTIPLDLHLTPGPGWRLDRTERPCSTQPSRWMQVGRITSRRPTHDTQTRHHGQATEPAGTAGAEPSGNNHWRLVSAPQLQSHLHNFLAQPAASADMQTAVAGLMAWWKLHEPAISDAASSELVAQIQHFIHTWLEQQSPSALIGSSARAPLSGDAYTTAAAAELAPAIYSSNDVAQLLNYRDSTIRRLAFRSWRQGPGPNPLRGIPGFYVVAQPNPGCGRGRGWKFQRVMGAAEQDTTRPCRATMSTRLALHDERRRMSQASFGNNHHGGAPSTKR